MTSPAPLHTGDDFDRCACERCRRAAIAWQQLEPLRRIAFRRTGNWVDAEDAAHEAIVRALEAPDLDLEQLPAWLTRVALNLCTDLARERARSHKRIRYQVMQQAAERDVESAVVDRAYSHSAYNLAMTLPPAQRAAVMMRADGRSVTEVARALDVSPKAAESLLSRARATIRRGLGGIVAFPLVLRRSGTVAPLAATAATLSTLFVLAPSLGVNTTHPTTKSRPMPSVRTVLATRVASAPAVREVHKSRTATPMPRPTPTSSSRRVLVAPQELQVGPGRVHNGGAGWTHPKQSLSDSVEQCLAQGIVVTTRYIGCRDADDGSVDPV